MLFRLTNSTKKKRKKRSEVLKSINHIKITFTVNQWKSNRNQSKIKAGANLSHYLH